MVKNTPKRNPDHAALDASLAPLLMARKNEEKRETEKETEEQKKLFDILNAIENCPVSYIKHCIGKLCCI